jgi:hypothetical protein
MNGSSEMGHSGFTPNRQGLFRETFLALFPVPRIFHHRAGRGEAISWTQRYRELGLLSAAIFGASLIFFAGYLGMFSWWAGNRLSRSGVPTAAGQIQSSSFRLPGGPRRQPGIAALLAWPC